MTTGDGSMSAAERAYRLIRGQILDGTHPPGTMLGEAALGTELEVSRTPVRVALARLQDEGWILIYPKRGAVVQGVDERTAAELADARFVLETTGVDRATPALRTQLADRLAPLVDRQEEAFSRSDIAGFIDLTLQFHRGFVEAGDNSVLLELYAHLSDRHRFILVAGGDTLLARCEDIIADHRALTNHLRNGEVEAFAQRLRSHIAGYSPVSALRSNAVH